MGWADFPWQGVRCLIPGSTSVGEDRQGLRSGGPREGHSGAVAETEARARGHRERVGGGAERENSH